MSKKLIVFFAPSNNEPKYLKTKHNIGRIFLEGVADFFWLNFEKHKNFYFAEYRSLPNLDIHFVYNEGYMNLAGESIWAYFSYKNPSQKYSSIELCLCHDDSDIVSGNAKLMVGGSSGGHKGVDSSYRLLAKKPDTSRLGNSKLDFLGKSQADTSSETKRLKSGDQSKIENLNWPPIRLKIGIRPPENKLKSETFVLKSITQEDQIGVDRLINVFCDKLRLGFGQKENGSSQSAFDWLKLQNLVNVKK